MRQGIHDLLTLKGTARRHMRGILRSLIHRNEVEQSVWDGRPGVRAESLWQDLRFGVRQMGRSPLFAIASVLMLAIGIGANTAIFSFVNSVLLRPPPYPDSNRLEMIHSRLGDSGRAPASTFELYQMRQRSREFDQIAGIWVTSRVLPGRREPEQGSGFSRGTSDCSFPRTQASLRMWTTFNPSRSAPGSPTDLPFFTWWGGGSAAGRVSRQLRPSCDRSPGRSTRSVHEPGSRTTVLMPLCSRTTTFALCPS